MPLNGASSETRVPGILRNNNDSSKSKEFHWPTVSLEAKTIALRCFFARPLRNQKCIAESLEIGRKSPCLLAGGSWVRFHTTSQQVVAAEEKGR
jgi:hypothetical protein